MALGLYVHVPFCSAICNYCTFNRGLFDHALKTQYVAAAVEEIRQAADGSDADTIFFGGGTPSLLEPHEIGAIVAACRHAFMLASDSEITLEANPESVTAERLEGFRAAGINRLSFGVQSFRDSELQRLSRLHSASRAKDALAAHARDELGLTDMHRARPIQAALASAAAFAAGAALPLVSAVLAPEPVAMTVVAALSLVFLASLGALAARVGNAGVVKGAWRVTFWGAIAMALTAAIGRAFEIVA